MKLVRLLISLTCAAMFLYLATRPDAPFVSMIGAVFWNCMAAYYFTAWMRDREKKSPDQKAD